MMRETEFQPVYASTLPEYPTQLPTLNPTRTHPWWMLLQCPSIWRTRWGFSFLTLKWITPSMGSGPEHSAPLKVKYHRLQQLTQPVILKAPTQTTRRAVSEKFLVNKHSCVIKKKKKRLVKDINYTSKLWSTKTKYLICMPLLILIQIKWDDKL